MRRYKVSIIGAGMVGATTAQCIAQRDIANVVLIDIVGDVAAGKALDIFEASPLCSFHGTMEGGDDYILTKDSDVIVITAGSPRKPGMSRKDLLEINARIVTDVVKKITNQSPDAVIIVVTNPVDALTYAAWQVSGFPRNRVMGMSGMLDSSRLKSFIASAIGVSVDDVVAMVVGAHSENHMLPLLRLANVNGIPIKEFLDEETLQNLAERTKQAGKEIVSLLKTGSAYYAPAAAITEMVEAILLDKKRLMPCSVCLEGEYGLSGCAICVPAILGKNGVERVIEINLTDEEKSQVEQGAHAVKEMLSSLEL